MSRADRIPYSIANIGASFTMNAPQTNSLACITATPQVLNQNGFLTDTTQWVQIQGCFTALGGEQYMTIGKFNRTGTDTLRSGTDNVIPGNVDEAYYYFDDFTLFDQSTVDVKDIKDNVKFEIYPNPTTGLINFSDNRYSQGDYTVKILDLFGKEIISKVLSEEIDISSFDKGVYTLLLYRNKQLVVTKKVMKD